MKKILTIGLLFAALYVSGCASSPVNPPSLYWGNYSHTLYNVKVMDDAQSHQKHEAGLLAIVEESQKRELRVPPGIYAELGIYALDRGDKAEAERYFSLEQQTYPESETLLKGVIK